MMFTTEFSGLLPIAMEQLLGTICQIVADNVHGELDFGWPARDGRVDTGSMYVTEATEIIIMPSTDEFYAAVRDGWLFDNSFKVLGSVHDCYIVEAIPFGGKFQAMLAEENENVRGATNLDQSYPDPTGAYTD